MNGRLCECCLCDLSPESITFAADCTICGGEVEICQTCLPLTDIVCEACADKVLNQKYRDGFQAGLCAGIRLVELSQGGE